MKASSSSLKNEPADKIQGIWQSLFTRFRQTIDVIKIFYSAGLVKPLFKWFILEQSIFAMQLLFFAPIDGTLRESLGQKDLGRFRYITAKIALYTFIINTLLFFKTNVSADLSTRLGAILNAKKLDKHLSPVYHTQPEMKIWVDNLMNQGQDISNKLLNTCYFFTHVCTHMIMILVPIIQGGYFWHACLLSMGTLLLAYTTQSLTLRISKLLSAFQSLAYTCREHCQAHEQACMDSHPNRIQRELRASTHYAALVFKNHRERTRLGQILYQIKEYYDFIIDFVIIPLVILRNYFTSSMGLAAFFTMSKYLANASQISTTATIPTSRTLSLGQLIETVKFLLDIPNNPLQASEHPQGVKLATLAPESSLTPMGNGLLFSGAMAFEEDHPHRTYSEVKLVHGLNNLSGHNGSGKSTFIGAFSEALKEQHHSVLTLKQHTLLPPEPSNLEVQALDIWPKLLDIPDPISTQRTCELQPFAEKETLLGAKFTTHTPPSQPEVYSSFDAYAHIQTLPNCKGEAIDKEILFLDIYRFFEILGGIKHFSNTNQPFYTVVSADRAVYVEKFQKDPIAFFKELRTPYWIEPDSVKNGGSRCLLHAAVYLAVAIHYQVDVLILDEIDREWDHETVHRWHELLAILNTQHFKPKHMIVLETTHRGAYTRSLNARYDHFLFAFQDPLRSICSYDSLETMIESESDRLELYPPLTMQSTHTAEPLSITQDTPRTSQSTEKPYISPNAQASNTALQRHLMHPDTVLSEKSNLPTRPIHSIFATTSSLPAPCLGALPV